jgi:hypothetical protein
MMRVVASEPEHVCRAAYRSRKAPVNCWPRDLSGGNDARSATHGHAREQSTHRRHPEHACSRHDWEKAID